MSHKGKKFKLINYIIIMLCLLKLVLISVGTYTMKRFSRLVLNMIDYRLDF